MRMSPQLNAVRYMNLAREGMTDRSYMNKKLRELTPEERKLFAADMAQMLSDELKRLDRHSLAITGRSIETSVRQLAAVLTAGFAGLAELGRRMKQPIGVLADNGWFLAPELAMDDLVDLASIFASGRVEEGDRRMVAFYEDIVESIEESIRKHFPHRERIVKAAFRAHRRKEYELSIPVMLTQADGICRDLIGTHLFHKRKGAPAAVRFADRFPTDFVLSSMLEPLRREGQIAADTRRVKLDPGVLNRHGILHGSMVDYSTETNSYKVISLLCFLVDTVREAVDVVPNNKALTTIAKPILKK